MRSVVHRFSFTFCVLFATTVASLLAICDAKEPSTDSAAAVVDQSETTKEKRPPKDTKAYRRFVDFSGYKWSIKLQDTLTGPGPNFFSDRKDDIWVDNEGLHLTISQRDEKWYCTEAILQDSFGYGTYIFQTKTEPEHLDANAVAGMFTWEAGLPWPNRELDFEFARWSKPDDPTNCQLVIQPFNKPGNLVRYRVEPNEKDPYLTHVMTWQKGRVHFQVGRGRFNSTRIPEEAIISAWTHVGSGVPEPDKENVRINLWLVDGKPPAADKPIDLIIAKFSYLPPEK